MKKNNHKLIFLIAPPRSLSTAFLRMMEARGDFKIFNEPASHIYNKSHYPQTTACYTEQSADDYHGLTAKLLSMLQDSHIFVKEMSFAFYEWIGRQPELLKDPRIYFVFLLRNPHHCVISYYNKIPVEHVKYMVPELAGLVAYKPLFDSHKMIKKQALNQAHLIQAEQLISSSKTSIALFCDYAGLSFKEDSLNWNTLGRQFTGQNEWAETKTTELTHHWHKEAIFSQGFHQPTRYHLDENKRPSFREIENVQHRDICQRVYEDYLIYYQAILDDFAVTSCSPNQAGRLSNCS